MKSLNQVELTILIRDPKITWYGPHQCNGCGEMIVKSAAESGGLALNAGAHEHHYPNFEWTQHKCANLAANGAKGGRKSKRVLTPDQAKDMVKSRESKKSKGSVPPIGGKISS